MNFSTADDRSLLTILPGKPTKVKVADDVFEVDIAPEELLKFADWFADLWSNEGESFAFPGADLVITFSHREHIGEGFVNVNFRGRDLGQAYEQLGTSNRYSADNLRASAKELS